ncbi:MAG: hypothetical protein IPO02_10965 [Bacteroidetes bacterium]|jgi:hypothetical protein|nr:hypothetical protein [Bacteroidota bacterium]
MANTSQAKKTNWVMIILLVVLVPVLLLGYKYFSKQIDENNHAAQSNEINSATQNNAVNSTPQSRDGNGAPAQNSGFPLVGDWYYKDNGAGPKYVNDKYSFTAPQMVNGELKGQLTMVMEWMGSVKSMNYEVINDGELRITAPDNAQSPYEMEYTYNAASQTLEIAEQGYHLTYTRNAPAANSHTNNNGGSSNNSGHTSNSYSTNTGSLKTAAEKMADIQWKMTATENGQTFHYTRKFSKPRVENGQVVGEYVRTYKQAGNYCTLETNYKYKMVSDSQYSWEILSAACDGKPENGDIGKTGIHHFELSNGGKTFLQWTAGKDRSTASIWTR